MFSHIDWLIHLEHHQDLLRAAEQERLAQLAVSVYPLRKTEKKEAAHLNNKPKSTSTMAVCCPSGAS